MYMNILDNVKYKKNKNHRISPKSFIYNNVYENVPKMKKKKKKISQNDFVVLKYKDFNDMLIINYNVKQLKLICSEYKLKKSGDKKELIHRVYNYLKYSYYSIIIQKNIRRYLQKKLNYLKGPSLFNKKCTNETDFFSLKSINDIKYEQFFSYKDNDGFIYGFDIKSLYKILDMSNSNVKNPYNRNEFPNNLKDTLKQILKLSKILNYDTDIVIKDELEKMSIKKKIELKTIKIFQNMDTHGFITNTSWFLNLDRPKLIYYLKELVDIWEYRANLTNNIKVQICPPNGRPFYSINILNMNVCNDNQLKLEILKIIEKFVTNGITKNDKSLGTYYVLGAFTIVSQEARNALPWMYETFRLNIVNN